VVAGSTNAATGANSFVGAGDTNTASGDNSFCGAGFNIQAQASLSGIVAGTSNTVVATNGFIGGGLTNTISSGATESVIVGGNLNTVHTTQSGILTGASNQIFGNRSCIGAGTSNIVGAIESTIVSGNNNQIIIGADDAFIGAGTDQIAYGVKSFIGGGEFNTTSITLQAVVANSAVVAGSHNASIGPNSFVGAGAVNTASGANSFCGAGFNNTASGTNSFIGAGDTNTALGTASVALGTQGHANTNGSFVFSDSTAATNALVADSFTVGCSGGAQFYSDNLRVIGVRLRAGATTWSVTSDRNLKENLIPLDQSQILEQVNQVPLYQYNFIGSSVDNINKGPMAQDWNQVFPNGRDTLTINSGDMISVALASIQALTAEVKALKQSLETAVQRIAQLENK
jgi:hypothetical protein